MESGKVKNIIMGLLVVIIICLLVIIGLFMSEKIELDESGKKVNNLEQQNSDIDDDTNEKEIYDERDFIRQTSVTLVEEPTCSGKDSVASLKASIDAGNVSISEAYGAITIDPGNAKYLYHVTTLACDQVKLYYITNDNNLYLINNPKSGVPNQKATKVTESKVVEFLGQEGREDGSRYLKVLLEDGDVEYINYFIPVE